MGLGPMVQGVAMQLLKWSVIAIALITLFAFLGMVPLFDVDEGAFSEATREMFHRRDFLTPWLNDQLRFDKPVLIYWFQGISSVMFGFNAFAMRLPSAIASILWCLLIYRFSKRYVEPAVGLIAVLVLVSALQMQLVTRAAIADALLNLFLTLSMFSFFGYDQDKHPKHLLWAYTAAGLGMLTKGPVAVVIPLAVMTTYLLIQRRLDTLVNTVFFFRGWLIFALINLPWYLTMFWLHGMTFVNGFFIKHNIQRFQTPFEGHSGSLWYYLPVLLVGLMPFTPLLLKAVFKVIKTPPKSDLNRFLWIWALFVLLFFSFSGTKLPHYVVYGYTPLLVLMAKEHKHLHQGWYIGPVSAFFLILALLPLAVSAVLPLIGDDFATEVITSAKPLFGLSFMSLLLALAVFLIFLWQQNRDVVLISTAAAMVIAMQVAILPPVAKVMQSPIKDTALYCREKQIRPILWNVRTPSFLFYYQDTLEARYPQPGDYVFTKQRYLSRLADAELLKQAHGYVLARIKSI